MPTSVLREATKIGQGLLERPSSLIEDSLLQWYFASSSVLAHSLAQLHEIDEAEVVWRSAVLASRRHVVLEQDSATSTLNLMWGLVHLAGLLRNRNQLDEAEPLLREAVDVGERWMRAGSGTSSDITTYTESVRTQLEDLLREQGHRL